MKKIIFYALFAGLIFSCAANVFCGQKINAATFNLRLAPKPTSNTWDLRKDAVGELVIAHKFDIFGTQEGYFHQLDDIRARTGFEYIGHGRNDGKKGGETSAIFYNPKKFALLGSGDFWFAPNPDKPVLGWDAACKRICSWGKFRDLRSGAKFYFFSLHFDHKGKVARAESAKLLLKKVEEISAGAPFFCVGDFNATINDEPMKILFAGKSFRDSKSIAKSAPLGVRGTFHDFTGKPKNDRIDYIFVSEGIGVDSYAVIDDSIEKLGVKSAAKGIDGGKAYPSDHFPVAIRAELK